MQVAAYAAALFFPRQNQVFTRALQVSSETHRMNRDAHLRGKVFQQMEVGGTKGLVGRPRTQNDVAERFSLMNQRDTAPLAVHAWHVYATILHTHGRRGRFGDNLVSMRILL